jgi:hypothetical protein
MRATAVPLYLGLNPAQEICSNSALSKTSACLIIADGLVVVAPLSVKVFSARLDAIGS